MTASMVEKVKLKKPAPRSRVVDVRDPQAVAACWADANRVAKKEVKQIRRRKKSIWRMTASSREEGTFTSRWRR